MASTADNSDFLSNFGSTVTDALGITQNSWQGTPSENVATNSNTPAGLLGNIFDTNYVSSSGKALATPNYSHRLGDTSERLFRVLPRYADPKWDASRGQRATIYLISQDNKDAASRGIDGPARAIIDNYLKQLTNMQVGFTDFLVTDIRASFDEKTQVTPVFGDTEVVYYFGKQPIFFDIGGVLIDDLQNAWFTNFLQIYAGVLRGSELARNAELLRIDLPSMSLLGSISAFSFSQDSSRDTNIPFQFRFVAKKIKPLTGVIPGVPLSNDITQLNLSVPGDFFASMSDINSIKNVVATLSKGVSPTSPVSANFDSLLGLGSISNALGNILGTGPRNATGGSAFGSVSNILDAQAAGFRGSLFSPVYGFLSSITKVVQNGGGDTSTIFSGLTNPVQTVLRDIRSITGQSTGLIHMLDSSVNAATSPVRATQTDYRNTLLSLSNSAGTITRAPETLSQAVTRMSRSGQLGSSFLGSGSNAGQKAAILSSGSLYSASTGANP